MVESKTSNRRKVYVIGNGMTRFMKPGKHSFDYHDLCHIAMKRALRDAGLKYDQIQQHEDEAVSSSSRSCFSRARPGRRVMRCYRVLQTHVGIRLSLDCSPLKAKVRVLTRPKAFTHPLLKPNALDPNSKKGQKWADALFGGRR